MLKKQYLIYVICISLFACGGKELPSSELISKDGLIYVEKTNELFTGKMIENYATPKDTAGTKSGSIKYSKTYKNGKLHGSFKEWYGDGQNKTEGSHKNGVREGRWRWWFSNAQLKIDCKFINDELDGRVLEYFENGQLWAEYTYKDGTPWESLQHFYVDGTEVGKNTLKDGTGDMYDLNASGDVLRRREFKDGRMVNSESYAQ